ncbi:MAG: competence damage-inducible protein A, partial [Candidatus Bathyarchaeia archaeon]
ALRMLRAKYGEMVKAGLRPKLDMTPERVKMATLPDGAEPLRNPIGSAPGVMLRCSGAVIIVLPGVPVEMKEIFRESVVGILEGEPSGFHYVEDSFLVCGVMESELAPVVVEVMSRHPSVYIKSHPRGIEGSPKIELHFSCNASDEAEGQREVAASLSLMKQHLGEMGGSFE